MVSKRGGGDKGGGVEARNVTAAVLLADSFTQRFRPITIERPKALLPLVNVPLIEYALEWLAMNGVNEVFVFCCAHADLIQKYFEDQKGADESSMGKRSKWASSKDMKVTLVVSPNCPSAGDALRLIDQRDVIKGDFILCHADNITNAPLAPILAAHRARRAADKNAIMTLVLKRAMHPSQRLRLGDSPLLVTLDPSTQRLLKLTEMDGKRSSTAKMDCSLFSERDEVQVRTDLMDTNIAICAPEVLLLFQDNFDYQSIRRDFVCGVLGEEEMGNKLFVHELNHEYAARVHNLRSYDAISRDILQRWAFPFVPDTNLLNLWGTFGLSNYRYARGQRYQEATVQVARSALLGEDIAVGAGTTIGENSRVAQSVIGRNVRIGRGCDIVGSYIQDNVVVQDGASVQCALVCDGAVLRAGCYVGPGAIVSYQCVIGPKHEVAANSRISLCRQLHDAGHGSDDELEYSASGVAPPGPRARGLTARVHAPQRAAPAAFRDDDDFVGSPQDSDDMALGKSLEKPSAVALEAAHALAIGQASQAADSANTDFEVEVVGVGGAGYQWEPKELAGANLEAFSIAAPPASLLQSMLEDPGAGAEASSGQQDAAAGEAGGSGPGESDEEGSGGAESARSSDDGGAAAAASTDPEHVWRREVQETFLRCIQMRFEKTNVKIELNALKIAENRTYADCARYMLTTLLGLALPAPKRTPQEYLPLYAKAAPDVSTKAGKSTLVSTFKQHLAEWKELLQCFLQEADDQIELLLTLEEYCSNDGVFEADSSAGACYAPVFAFVLKELYDADLVSSEAVVNWADEKAHADPEERRFVEDPDVKKVVDWLREEEEDDDDEEEDDEDKE